MKPISVLYVSGSLGLGHVTRDIAIASQLRALLPEAEIEWLAANPAARLLQDAGEPLVAGADRYANPNEPAERSVRGSSLNLLSYMVKAKSAWKANAGLFLQLVTSKRCDLVVGDETYEINVALREHPKAKTFRYAFIVDFVGLHAMTKNPFERLGVYYWNRVWSRDYRLRRKPPYDLGLFVGEPEDIPDSAFGPGLPSRRDFARAMYTFVGYVFPFDVAQYANKQEVRKKLGYGAEPLIICSIGGTAIGRELLELCGCAAVIARQQRPDLRVVLVTGPRLPSDSVTLPGDVEVREFVPRLYEHFAACDLAVVQGGATSTAELSALRTPFIYFPIEGHSEQADVARTLARRGAGIRMSLARATPESLARQMIAALGTTVTYPEIPADGARKAAEAIARLLA
jgi:UDP:flavonoid glycosyltransferase YjiC (YdhE family)